MNNALLLQSTATLAAAVVLDMALGEPRRFHPLVGFGRCAQAVERRANRGGQGARIWLGAMALLIVTAPPVGAVVALRHAPLHFTVALAAEAVVLYFALGLQSLGRHARDVTAALNAGDLARARNAVARMVSRDAGVLDEPGVAAAATESVLENGNDAVFGVVFWYLVLGLPGALAYRLVNTLDAMWGYRNARFCRFGRCAARIDDAVNFFPARVTAFFYALGGDFFCALRCWRAQGSQWKSGNAGAVMSAGAGALRVRLGGAAVYQSKPQPRPTLGAGAPAAAADIARAINLVWRGLVFWLLLAAAVEWGLAIGSDSAGFHD
ncbi:MAG: adenosylcobinamide-phosphate synthase CbiB [Gammaproteobacteria bacterium]|nr:adenosylcobinamide-phosphate synthase CbiB [Gammaproteobacteria bacterium]